MDEIFRKRSFFVKEKVGLANLYESYEVQDFETKKILGYAVEQACAWQKFQKLFLDKDLLPLTIKVNDVHGRPLLELRRPRAFFRSVVTVENGAGDKIGTIKQTSFSLMARLEVFDAGDKMIGTINGDWKNREFLFSDLEDKTIAKINHQFGGLAREILTSADDYLVKIIGDQAMAPMILAAVLTVDFAYHEA